MSQYLRAAQHFSRAITWSFIKKRVISGSMMELAALIELCVKYGIQYEIHDGFYIMGGKYACRHVWITVDGQILDPGKDVINIIMPRTRQLNLAYSDTLPSGVKQVDNETTEERERLHDVEIGIKNLRISTDKYWSDTPGNPKIKNMGRRLVSKIVSKL